MLHMLLAGNRLARTFYADSANTERSCRELSAPDLETQYQKHVVPNMPHGLPEKLRASL